MIVDRELKLFSLLKLPDRSNLCDLGEYDLMDLGDAGNDEGTFNNLESIIK